MNRLMHMGVVHGAPDCSDAYIEAERKFRRLSHRETAAEQRRREALEAEKPQPLDGLTAEAIEGFRKVLDDRGAKLVMQQEAPKADPYAELKVAHAAGKVIEYMHPRTNCWVAPPCSSDGFSWTAVLKVSRDALAYAEAAGFVLQYKSKSAPIWKARWFMGVLSMSDTYRVEPRDYTIAELQRLHDCGLPVQWGAAPLISAGVWNMVDDSCLWLDGPPYKHRLAPHESGAA
jgi:hypothetical protein